MLKTIVLFAALLVAITQALPVSDKEELKIVQLRKALGEFAHMMEFAGDDGINTDFLQDFAEDAIDSDLLHDDITEDDDLDLDEGDYLESP